VKALRKIGPYVPGFLIGWWAFSRYDPWAVIIVDFAVVGVLATASQGLKAWNDWYDRNRGVPVAPRLHRAADGRVDRTMSDGPEFDPEAVLEQSRHDPLPCPIGMDDAPFICSAGVCDGLVCTQSRLFRAYVANESLRAERACLLAIKDAARRLADASELVGEEWDRNTDSQELAEALDTLEEHASITRAALSALPEDPAGG
jgi:hypothetical protein